MNKNYLIILTPLDWFFFGGEHTHGEGQKSGYLSKSNLFPQQSAILGMLRYQLLKQNDLLSKPGEDKNTQKIQRIRDLIGEQSFNMSNIDKEGGLFGKIRKISPLFIGKADKNNNPNFYFPEAFDYGYNISFKTINNICLNVDKSITKIIDDNKTFDHKTYKNYALWRNSRGDIVNSDDIWERKIKIGITKLRENEEDNEKNFYKQEYLLLKENFKYVFLLSLDKDAELFPDNVFMGGQQSVFKMDIKPVADGDILEHLKNEIPVKAHPEKLILLSDAYIEDISELNKLCLFQWSYPVTFRNIETTIGKSNYHIKPTKSTARYNFFQKGSVFYFEKEKRKEVEKLLKNQYLQSSGYNIFI